MPDGARPLIGVTALGLLELSHEYAALFVGDFFLGDAFAAERADDRLRYGLQGQAQQFFVFVMLSLLLERHAGAPAENAALAEELKKLFASEITENLKTVKSIVGSAPEGDPFEPYYDSFARGARDVSRTPFAIFARRFSQAHFPESRRAAAYDRLFALSAAYADKIADSLNSPAS